MIAPVPKLIRRSSFRRRNKTRIFLCAGALLAAIALVSSCGRPPEVEPVSAPPRPTPPPVPAGFVMKPFQVSMHDEMRKSYELADEVMAGILSGVRDDDVGSAVYYFEDFSLFHKETLSWGRPMDVIVEVRPGEFKPEIIRREEVKRLVPLDRIGICWDVYEGRRAVFLVEGQRNLVFLKVGLDEAAQKSFRTLLDAYPVTAECRAVDVFNLMIRHLVESDRDSQDERLQRFLNPAGGLKSMNP